MSVCAKQLQFLTDCNKRNGGVSNAGSAQQVLFLGIQVLCSLRRRVFAGFRGVCVHVFCIHSPLSGITYAHTCPPFTHSLTHPLTHPLTLPLTRSFIHSFSLGSVPLRCHVDKFNMLQKHPEPQNPTHWLSDFASLSLFASRVCVCIIFATSRLLFTVQRAALLYFPPIFCFTAPI